MNRTAHITSIETIRRFRPALVKFADQVRQALTEVQGEMQRTAAWLEQEQGPFWQRQLRKRQEEVQQAKQALNAKKLFDSPTVKQTAVDEERALRRAKRRLEEAEQKIEAVRRWRRELEREWMRQQGQLQRLSRAVEQDVPRAVALLERMSRSLEAYVALAAPRARDLQEADEYRSMARGGEVEAESAEAAADAASDEVAERDPSQPSAEDDAGGRAG